MAQSTWGWHRLDDGWAGRLVALADLPPRSLVLDIGAGDGALTGPLVAAGHRVIAVERHPARAAVLRATFGRGVTVVVADAADLRLPRRPFHVVANPPFGVTSALMRRLLHPGSRMITGTLILQTPAARRWAGERRDGGRFTLGPPVPRSAFRPRPRVDCRVLRVERR